MSDSGRKKPPLVAEKRYKNPKKTVKTAKKPAATRKPRKKAPAKKTRRNPIIAAILGLFRWVLRLIWGFSWRIGLIVCLLIAMAVGYFYTTLPPVNELLDGRAKGSVTMMDRDEKIFAWRGDTFGGAVTAESVSPHLKNAVIATEDKRFYLHFGLSPRGIASAIRASAEECLLHLWVQVQLDMLAVFVLLLQRGVVVQLCST